MLSDCRCRADCSTNFFRKQHIHLITPSSATILPFSSLSFLISSLSFNYVQFRLLTAFGGPDTIVQLPVLFDTGLSILSLFDHDLIAMGFHQASYPDVGSAHITTVDSSTAELSGHIIE